eukprot:scaffold59581_cov63-Phaeocystis_antarctica.AAC.1
MLLAPASLAMMRMAPNCTLYPRGYALPARHDACWEFIVFHTAWGFMAAAAAAAAAVALAAAAVVALAAAASARNTQATIRATHTAD